MSSAFRRPMRSAGPFLLAAIVGLLLAPNAHAEFGIRSFDGEVINRDGMGNAVAATQAGSHPDEASATIEFNDIVGGPLNAEIPDGQPKNISVDLPPGFVGNPLATARCTEAQLGTDLGGLPTCPLESQVGVVTLRVAQPLQTDSFPVYNMMPPPGVPGAFAFKVANVPIHLRAEVRSSGDFGLTINVTDISQALAMLGTRLTFWGVPAARSHDFQRGPCLDSGVADPACMVSAEPKAFLSNPTRCAGPLTTHARSDAWAAPGVFSTASFVSHRPPPDETVLVGAENCDVVPFEAKLTARPTNPIVGQPSGFVFDISVPQNDDPRLLAQGHLKKATVRLPQGVTVSPSAATGLKGCSIAEVGLGTLSDPACPDGSKVGKVTIDTPLLEQPMRGSVYLAQQTANPFSSLLALYLVARGPGVTLKLPGRVDPDPITGQLTATFDDNPQLPFSNLRLEFASGSRASLNNPPTCGTYTTVSTLESWSGKAVTSESSFTVTGAGDSGQCGRRFAPKFSAGLRQPVGGSSSPLDVTFSREDADQLLSAISVDTPPGLTGVIASADLCSDALASAGTCGERSRIGSVATVAGPGPTPFYLAGGRVYITGPYKGGPFGLSIVVPAKAGPFDLGTVVVRAAIHVDRRSAALSVIADPLPTILQGIPLQVRKVMLTIDKPGFMRAPTSCRARSIDGRITSTAGAIAAVASRFQVGSCGALPYKPKLSIRIGDRRHRRAESTAPLQATLTMPTGSQANNRSVSVTLPRNVNSRLATLRGACSVEAARARTCGQRSIVGRAVAVTPLLRDPLTGPVYIVRTVGNRLPDLWVALRGQIEFDLIARVRVTRSLQLRTTFGEVPDVPVSKFRLAFLSDADVAPIGLVRGICSKRVQRGMVAGVSFRAQNGRLVERRQKMAIRGCGRVSSGRGATRRSGGRRSARRAVRKRVRSSR